LLLTSWETLVESVFGCDHRTVDYLVRCLPETKLTYIEVPKAACSTLKASLLAWTGSDRFTLLSEIPDHARAIFFSRDYKRFTFVRNPYSRILSGYLDKIVADEAEWARLSEELQLTEKPSFRDFLVRLGEMDPVWIDIHFKSQFLLTRPDVIDYDFIGRFETLDRDAKILQVQCFGWTESQMKPLKVEAPHAVGASSRVAEYFDQACQNLTYRLFERDFDIFRYPRALPL
jgi:hypothetical protein